MDDFNKHLSTYCDTRLHELRRQGEIERLFDFQEVATSPAVVSMALLIGVVAIISVLCWWVL
jgi:hypothetical protein